MAVLRPALPSSRAAAAYPHVAEVRDVPTQATVRLLWDRIFTLESRLTAADLKSEQQGNLLVNLQETLTVTTRLAQAAEILAGKAVGSGAGVGSGGGGTGEPIDPNDPGTDITWDSGQGAAGYGAAGVNGHVLPGSPLTPFTVVVVLL